MTAKEIRNIHPDNFTYGLFLREVAAQLAESNERQARQEKLGNKIAKRSLDMMDRADKELSVK